jgi:hypothetical protein
MNADPTSVRRSMTTDKADLTDAGRWLLAEHGSGSAHMVQHIAMVEAEAITRNNALLAEKVRGLHGTFHPMTAIEAEPTQHDVVSRKAVLRLLEDKAEPE